LHPYQAVIHSNDGSTVAIPFDEMLFAVGHSFVEGTHHHKRALERLTNALFQTTSTKVYRRTATINIDGCRVSKNRDPLVCNTHYYFLRVSALKNGTVS
jgi:hypothetical protein